MEVDDKYLSKNKRDYLKLFLKIWTMRRHGSEPPKELLQLAHEMGRLAGISEQEFKNL